MAGESLGPRQIYRAPSRGRGMSNVDDDNHKPRAGNMPQVYMINSAPATAAVTILPTGLPRPVLEELARCLPALVFRVVPERGGRVLSSDWLRATIGSETGPSPTVAGSAACRTCPSQDSLMRRLASPHKAHCVSGDWSPNRPSHAHNWQARE